MIDMSLMKDVDVQWLDAYHQEVGAGCVMNDQVRAVSVRIVQLPLNRVFASYRAQVWEAVSPRLADKPEVLEWLRVNTRPLQEQKVAQAAAAGNQTVAA